ncbi:MAG: biotin--[acetyl-CoA-carboxylase] ligase [Acidobacteriaceae bacterium]|jgi:BirA family biotin operon repressor/biotin-[acetyl-CoA-carboxylase] ligase
MPTDPFDLRAVEQAIANTEFAGHLMHFHSVASTNDLALEATKAGARHGVWIADAQTTGRGRGSHAWYSAAGTPLEPAGLYMTALIAPPVAMQHALSLSLTTAIAVQSAISSVAGFRRRDQIDIRWPNDLLLNARKCGGILIETASNPATPTQPVTLRYAVIGIGINVNHTSFPPEIDAGATSLRRELPDLSQPLRREPLTAAILLALDQEIRRLTSNLEPRTSNLTPFSSWISGKRVRVEERNDDPGGYTGITAGLDRSGFLLVNGDDGQLHTVLSGGLREP